MDLLVVIYLRHTNGINYGNAATITMGGWSKIPGSAVDSNYRYLCSVKSGGEVLGLAIHIDQNNASQSLVNLISTMLLIVHYNQLDQELMIMNGIILLVFWMEPVRKFTLMEN